MALARAEEAGFDNIIKKNIQGFENRQLNKKIIHFPFYKIMKIIS